MVLGAPAARTLHRHTQARPAARPLAAALLLALPILSLADADLPDLGTPKPSASQTNFRPGPNGLAVDSRDNDSRLAATAETSQQTGVALGLHGALSLFDGAALGGGLMAGRNKTEVFANLGWNIDAASRLVLTGAQLTQKLNFDFPSGKARADMTQNAYGAAYRYRLGGGLVDHAELTAYEARTASRDLGAVDYTVDTAAVYELWRDPRRVAGGKVSGFQGSLGLIPWQGGGVKLGLGQERLTYDLSSGAETHSRPTASAKFEQTLSGNLRLKAGYEGAAAQGRATLGLDVRLADLGTLGLEAASVKGRDGAPGDNRLQVSWTFPLGRMAGGSGAAPLAGLRAAPANAAPRGLTAGSAPASAAFSDSDLLDQVAQRPGWLPSQVVARRDTTAGPTRLIAVDKAALPAGSSVAANGAITAPLGIVAAGIAGVTKNGGAFVNTGQFALSGNNVVVNPNLITQPAVGVVDTYVVTVNIAGGGTSLVTVKVSHGSVKIDSITVTAGGSAPTASAVSITGTAQVGQVLTGHYTYADADSNPEGTSTFRWLRNGIAIGGATAITYTLVNADYNTVITFEATPVATVAPTTGTAVVSGATASVTLPAGYVSQGGLIWMPNNIGPWGGNTTDWNTANTYCTTTTIIGQTGWRMPTTAELSALSSSGAIAGQGWLNSATWSSTPHGAGNHENVNLTDGSVAWGSDAFTLYVTCVR